MCWLPLIAGACLMGSEELTVQGDMSWQVSGNEHFWALGTNYGGGWFGEAYLTMDAELSRSWTLQYGIQHRSLLNTNRDRGEERFVIGLKWQPFRN